MAREITIDSVLLMSRIQKLHNIVVYVIGKRVDELEVARNNVSSEGHPELHAGYREAIEDMRGVLSRVELEKWQMEVQLKMLETSLGE